MKLKVNLKNKEASFEADVEGLVEKSMEKSAGKPPKKTRYQIRQEEKRKNAELKQKHNLQMIFIYLSFVVILIVFCIIIGVLEK